MQIQNATFIPAFLLNNAMIAFLFQNASPVFINNARSASNMRLASQRLQNTRPVFCLYQNVMPAFLTQNAMAAFQHHAKFAFH